MTPRPTSEGTAVQPAMLDRRPWYTRVSGTHLVVVAAGLLALVANLAVLRSADDRVGVVVAGTELGPGTVLTSADLATVLVDVPDDVMAGLVRGSELDELEGSVVVRRVAASEMLRRSDLVAPAAPDGGLAMSIPVDPSHAAGGILRQGDRVDVIRVIDGVAEFVVTDVPVLSVAPTERGAIGSPGGYFVVVAVDRPQSLLLAEAISSGALEIVASTGAEASR